MEPLIFKTPVAPLPRPLEQEQQHKKGCTCFYCWERAGRNSAKPRFEQEQWTVERTTEKCWIEVHEEAIAGSLPKEFSGILRIIADAHNTSLRALQEELQGTRRERGAETKRANQKTSLVACQQNDITALQEEHDCDIAVIIGPLRCKLSNAFAACKAKDEALKRVKTYMIAWSADFDKCHNQHKMIAIIDAALQPDSSVKPEQT